jgi:hypothetical protein
LNPVATAILRRLAGFFHGPFGPCFQGRFTARLFAETQKSITDHRFNTMEIIGVAYRRHFGHRPFRPIFVFSIKNQLVEKLAQQLR